MRHTLATLTLGPLLYLQGRRTRRLTPVLPEPPGERRGSRGSGTPLRLLITGDSAAAGVGAAHQDDALCGRLVEALSQRFGVDWELHAKTGATTYSTLDYLRRLERVSFDLAITSLGVNDITGGTSLTRWLDMQRELRALLREKFSTRLILVSGLPPMGLFPALPQPLRWYLGRRADELDAKLELDLDGETDSVFIDLRFGMGRDAMATDGFHPGPPVYAEWARRASGLALSRL